MHTGNLLGVFGLGVGFDDAVDFAAEGLTVREVELITADEELVGDSFQSILHDQPVFLRSEDDAEWLIVSFCANFVFEVVEVEVHLADILMLYAVFLEVDETVCL